MIERPAGGGCPERVAVIGGGRWARVLTEVVCGLVPTSVEISVHSPHNARSMSVWASENLPRGRVSVSAEWPSFASASSSAVIVANAAKDHEKAVEWCISSGVPVLVEKPISLTANGALRLVQLADRANVRLAPAHVFLFAGYVARFATMIGESGKPKDAGIRWTDPRHESRYGEPKRYDPGLPIFADWLPHIVSLLSTIFPQLPNRFENLRVLKGGSQMELDLMVGDTRCSIEMTRDSDLRRREFEVATDGGTFRLDFSREPGSITRASKTLPGEDELGQRPSPAAAMLSAFLRWAAGGAQDPRFDTGVALAACQMIDLVAQEYRSIVMPWLSGKLNEQEPVSEDARYALRELLQTDGFLPAALVDQAIERTREEFGAAERKPRWHALAEAGNPATLLRGLVT